MEACRKRVGSVWQKVILVILWPFRAILDTLPTRFRHATKEFVLRTTRFHTLPALYKECIYSFSIKCLEACGSVSVSLLILFKTYGSVSEACGSVSLDIKINRALAYSTISVQHKIRLVWFLHLCTKTDFLEKQPEFNFKIFMLSRVELTRTILNSRE